MYTKFSHCELCATPRARCGSGNALFFTSLVQLVFKKFALKGGIK